MTLVIISCKQAHDLSFDYLTWPAMTTKCTSDIFNWTPRLQCTLGILFSQNNSVYKDFDNIEVSIISCSMKYTQSIYICSIELYLWAINKRHLCLVSYFVSKEFKHFWVLREERQSQFDIYEMNIEITFKMTVACVLVVMPKVERNWHFESTKKNLIDE